MNTVQHLAMALEKLQRGWCKGSLATDRFGEPVHPGQGGATQFCIMGALVQPNIGHQDYHRAITTVYEVLPEAYKRRGPWAGVLQSDEDCVAMFNDNTGTNFQDVERVMAAAIELAKTCIEAPAPAEQLVRDYPVPDKLPNDIMFVKASGKALMPSNGTKNFAQELMSTLPKWKPTGIAVPETA